VVGGGLEDRGGALFLYRSADLRTWEYAGVWAAAADYGLDGGVWECPDVFVLGGTVVVVVSVCDADPPWVMWMTGQLDGQRFVPAASGRLDAGYRYYAPQSLTMADGRRVAFGWIREDVDELTGPDRSRVGVMSLPWELFLDSGGALRSRPARELDGARRENVVSRLADGRGSAAIALSARSGQAAEFSVTPAGREATAVGLRLAGPGSPDVEIRVTAGGIEITEGGRRLTEQDSRADADGAVGQVRAWYDRGILEVFSPAAAAAVSCDRDGGYDRLDVEIAGRPGAPSERGRLDVWSCGIAEG
jgi:beta-fructofuranosidase